MTFEEFAEEIYRLFPKQMVHINYEHTVSPGWSQTIYKSFSYVYDGIGKSFSADSDIGWEDVLLKVKNQTSKEVVGAPN